MDDEYRKAMDAQWTAKRARKSLCGEACRSENGCTDHIWEAIAEPINYQNGEVMRVDCKCMICGEPCTLVYR